PSILFSSPTSTEHRLFHSFPTRRSSDLAGRRPAGVVPRRAGSPRPRDRRRRSPEGDAPMNPLELHGPEFLAFYVAVFLPVLAIRSEEHTSELQSPYDLVCRLLLEKKNKN